MPARHVVVDGSNIATEGRSLPSLKQLDEAVREFLIENPDDVVTVVVDATFGHRISPDERDLFEEAEGGGEIVSPPAGAIGRGDAFLLRVADRVGAVVLSNDSFQEFHGEYEWLFDKGRLIGGKPVPGVGWIFTPRTPVRGPKSRESVKEAKRKRHADRATEAQESGLDMAAERSRGYVGERKLQRAIAAAVEEAVEPAKGGRKRRRRRRGSEGLSEPLNEPLKFITFIAANQLGDEVEGTVEEFSSHGAFVSVDGARCYVPLSAMSRVAPRSAREVLRKGERRAFVVQAFDAMRRGIELALPGFAHPAGAPTAETIDAEIHHGEADGQLVPAEAALTSTVAAELSTSEAPPSTPTVRRAGRAGTLAEPAPAPAPEPPVPAKKAAAKAATRKRAVAGQQSPPQTPRAAARKSTAEQAGTKRTAAAKKSAPVADKAAPKVAAKRASSSAPPQTTTPQTTDAANDDAANDDAANDDAAKGTPQTGTPAQAERQSARRGVAKRTAGEEVAGQTALRKSAASKSVASKSAASKSAASKSAASKSAASKSAASKSVASKSAASKSAPSKSAPSKSAASQVGSRQTDGQHRDGQHRDGQHRDGQHRDGQHRDCDQSDGQQRDCRQGRSARKGAGEEVGVKAGRGGATRWGAGQGGSGQEVGR